MSLRHHSRPYLSFQDAFPQPALYGADKGEKTGRFRGNEKGLSDRHPQ